jgi:hypothetical protein
VTYEEVPGDFIEKPCIFTRQEHQAFFPDPHESVLGQIRGEGLIPASIVEISSDIVEVLIENGFELLLGHLDLI